MCLHKFISHENVPDNQVEKSQFYNDPEMDKPELFHDELSRLTLPLAVVTSNTEDYDKENPQEIKLLPKPEMHQS